jgi:hypothetical protein
VGTLNAAPSISAGVTWDANLGLVFDGTANRNVSFDVSNITALQNLSGGPYMIYMEVERALLAVLPSVSGLANTADYAGGIPLTNASVAFGAFWPTAEAGTSNGMTMRADLGYTGGTGDKVINLYGGAGSLSVNGIYTYDAARLEGDTHIPVVFAVDGNNFYMYVDGAYVIVAGGTVSVAGYANALKTVVFGRRFSGDSANSFQDGHIRNLMVIEGRSPLYGTTYGAQSLQPASVFNKTLQFGDSYAGVTTSPSASAPHNVISGSILSAYLKQYGYGTANINEATNDFYTSSIMSGLANPGYKLIGWNTTAKPVNCATTDAQAYPNTSNYVWDAKATLLSNNPTCVLFQLPVNDFGQNFSSSLSASYSRWIKYFLEYLFGLNGNAATTVKAVGLIMSPWPPFLADGSSQYRRRGAALAAKAAQAAVSWFQQTYPSLASYVTMSDLYTAFGGDNPYQEYFVKLPSTDVHMGVLGKIVQAQIWGQTLLNLQSQINGTALLPSSVAPIAQNLRSYQAPGLNGPRLLGKLLGANMNVTTDQAIYLNAPQMGPSSTKYRITKITVTNASVSLTTAAGGFYTAVSKGGTTLVSSGQVYSSLTASNIPLDVTLAAGATGFTYNTRPTAVAQGQTNSTTPIYFSLTTGQGVAATADIYVYGDDLT